MVGRLEAADGRGEARDFADAEITALRHGGEFQGYPVFRRVRHQQDRQHRSEHDGDSRIRSAQCGDPSAPHRHHQRRCDLVLGLFPRLSGPVRSQRRGKVSEWPSPGGPQSQPYGIVAIKDNLWYSESGVKPNTLVRFDPKTENFQTWVIPSGGGVVRNMDVTRDGNIVLACSGVNRVALVEIK